MSLLRGPNSLWKRGAILKKGDLYWGSHRFFTWKIIPSDAVYGSLHQWVGDRKILHSLFWGPPKIRYSRDPKKVLLPELGKPNRYKPLRNPSFHLMFHGLFHWTLDSWGAPVPVNS